MPASVMLDVFGKRVIVERQGVSWQAYLVGDDGKRSPMNVAIPDSVDEAELAQYFDDLFHEAASPRRPPVVRLS